MLLGSLIQNPQAHPGDPHLLLGVARVYDALNDMEKGIQVRILVICGSEESRICPTIQTALNLENMQNSCC